MYSFAPPPKIRKEGFVVINKELVYVTFDDLERRVIRLSRTLKTKKGTLNYADFVNNTYGPRIVPLKKKDSISAEDPTEAARGIEWSKEALLLSTPFPTSIDQFKDEPKPGDTIELAESKAIDLAFSEQERALLHTFLEKESFEDYEDWEVSETA